MAPYSNPNFSFLLASYIPNPKTALSNTMTGFLKKKATSPLAVYDGVAEGLKEIYKKKLLPLERESKFHEIQSPMMEDPDFEGKPLVMLIGQYSTGKTTFLR